MNGSDVPSGTSDAMAEHWSTAVEMDMTVHGMKTLTTQAIFDMVKPKKHAALACEWLQMVNTAQLKRTSIQ